MQKLRILLFPFALIFMTVSAIRNALYNKGVIKSRSFTKSIIVVGNLSVGGTGKSPMTMYLVNLLSATYKTATLSRGYGRKSKGFLQVLSTSNAEQTGDEPLMFANELPKANVFVGEDRCAAIDKILESNSSTQVIVLDDAFQHRKVKAGLNILLTRYDNPFWSDYVMPVGSLRENANGAARAQAIIITNCPLNLSNNEKELARKNSAKYSSAPVYFSIVNYASPKPIGNQKQWQNQYDSILCVSGIANASSFQNQAKTYATNAVNMAFVDHHEFSQEDANNILAKYQSLSGSKCLLITAKDKARMMSSAHCLNMLNEIENAFYQPIEFSILDDSKKFDLQVLQYAQKHS